MPAQCIYSPDKGKLYDFFAVLNMSTKFDKMEDFTMDIGFNDNIASAYSRVYECIRPYQSSVRLFCESNSMNESFFHKIFGCILLRAESIDDIINAFNLYNHNDMIIQLLSYYDEKNDFSDYFYKRLVSDKELLLEFLNGLDISAEKKWELVSFIDMPAPYIDRLNKLFNKIKIEIEEEYHINRDMLQDYYKKVEKDFDNKRVILIKSDPILYDIINSHSFATIQFSITLFTPYSIQYLCDNRNLNIYLGYDYEAMMDYYNREKMDNILFFKSFTDNTRNRILNLLTNRDLTAGDIAKELGVSPSSLSHHLDVLTSAEIIKKKNNGKRSCFTINKSAVMLAIQELSKLANP